MALSKPSAQSYLLKLWLAYEASLEKAPIRTKALTSAALSALGDIVSQKLLEKKRRFRLYKDT